VGKSIGREACVHIPDDPQVWSQGAAAFKSIFDGLRSAIGMVRDLRGTDGSGDKASALIDAALDHADKAAGIAQAEVAKALGYELCKCEFPPTPMLTVGVMAAGSRTGPVYECPKCKTNSAYPYTFTRTAEK
jgi:hypothetical protein